MEQSLEARCDHPAHRVFRSAVLGWILLALVPAAGAGVIFPATTATCMYTLGTGATGDCIGAVSQLPEQNGMAGARLYLPDALVLPGSTGWNMGGFNLMSAGGLNLPLAAGTTIPLHYAVTLSPSAGSTVEVWQLGMWVAPHNGVWGGGSWGTFCDAECMTANGSGTFTGFAAVTTLLDLVTEPGVYEGMRLGVSMTVWWTAADDQATLTFTVSPEAFEFNPVPEPASLALAGLGLGFVALVPWYRRKIGAR